MAKKIAVLLDDMVNEQEFIYPYYRLKEAGFESVSVAAEKRVYKSKYGMSFTPDMLIEDVTPGEFDGVIVPGGYAPDFLRRKKNILSLIGEVNHKGKLVAIATSRGAALKRVGESVPGIPYLRQFESVGGLGDSLLVRTEDVEGDGMEELPVMHGARLVLGVLYDSQ